MNHQIARATAEPAVPDANGDHPEPRTLAKHRTGHEGRALSSTGFFLFDDFT
jgi:hypothetical protein